jgi:hypothetical protein
MSWKDRIQGKTFEYIEPMEHGGEKVQSIKNNNKYKVPKDYLRDFTHKTQKPQKPQKGEGNTHRRVKIRNPENNPTPAQETPAPSPASLGPEYENLWHRAWKLANEIDNPGGAPLAERRAKLPELDDLRARMATIERQAAPTAAPDPETSPPGTWHPWESSSTTTPEQCPAKCKRSGKCYARAYFEGKPGRAKDCDPDTCDHRGTPATGRFFDTQSEKGKSNETGSC